MRHIYNKAGEVYIYLGEEADSSEDIPILVEKVLAAVSQKRAGHEWTLQEIGLPLVDDYEWDAWRIFLRRPWFTRLWIIQEAVLADHATVFCGSWTMDFVMLERMIELDLPVYGAGFGGRIYSRSMGGVPLRLSGRVRDLTMERQAISLHIPYGSHEERLEETRIQTNVSAAQLRLISMLKKNILNGKIRLWDSSAEAPDERYTDLLWLLRRSRRSLASVPVDYLYGVLGLSDEGNALALSPVYEETLFQTLLRYAQYFVKSGRGPELLTYVHCSSWRAGLPSWIPGWALEDKFAFSRFWEPMDMPLKYSTTGFSSTQMNLSKDGYKLHVKAVVVDIIEQLGPKDYGAPGYTHGLNRVTDLDDETLNFCFGAMDTLLSQKSAYLRGDDTQTKQNLHEVKWMTSVTGQSSPSGMGPYNDIMAYLSGSARASWGSEDTRETYRTEYVRQLFLTMIRMRVCRTAQGYLVQSPFETGKNDVIALVARATMPFLLQPRDEEYLIIGPCYIYSMMNRELAHELSGPKAAELVFA